MRPLPDLGSRARPNLDAVVIAASLGGPEALTQVLQVLPDDFPAPIVVVQHTSRTERTYLTGLLRPKLAIDVKTAEDGQFLQPGCVYVAPPRRHLLMNSADRCRLADSAPVNFVRPAADPLFESAAAIFGSRTLGVVLTGRLYDGTRGARAIMNAGGVVLVQDPSTCIARGMPESVIRAGAAHFVLPPPVLGHAILSLTAMPGVPALFGLRQRPVAV